MMEPLIFVILGLATLVGGGELLVKSASRIASALGVPPLVIGLTIVAYGTSMPELGVSLVAALDGNPDIALANVIGSNIFNILLILGLSSGINSGLKVDPSLLQFDLLFMIGISITCLSLLITGKRLVRWEGAVLFFGYVTYTVFLIYRG